MERSILAEPMTAMRDKVILAVPLTNDCLLNAPNAEVRLLLRLQIEPSAKF